MNAKTRISCGLLLGAALAACSSAPPKPEAVAHMIKPQRVTDHRGADDLLTAGLGLDGLRAMAAPTFADPANPTPATPAPQQPEPRREDREPIYC